MENNLIRENFWNSYFVKCENYSTLLEIKDIIIYNDNGILVETSCGWFNESNNDTGSKQVKNGIYKRNINNVETSKKKHENFIILCDKEYSWEDKTYTLYIYYENINYRFIEIKKDNNFVNIVYELFDTDKKYESVIGFTDKYSSKIKYLLYDEIDNLAKNKYDFDKVLQSMETIKKLMKKYNKEKEKEKDYSCFDLISNSRNNESTNLECYNNNLKLKEEK